MLTKIACNRSTLYCFQEIPAVVRTKFSRSYTRKSLGYSLQRWQQYSPLTQNKPSPFSVVLIYGFRKFSSSSQSAANSKGESRTGPEGTIYEGTFSGQKLLHGRIILADGRIYEGEFDLDSGHIKDGGTLLFPVDSIPYVGDDVCANMKEKVATYKGQFASWYRHGKGKTVYPQGYVIEEGQYENNELQEGRVVILNSPAPSSSEGLGGGSSSSDNDMVDVNSKVEPVKGNSGGGVTAFEGKLRDGHFAQGKLTSSTDHSCYEGEFNVSNVPHGKGKLTYKTSSSSSQKTVTYTGEFQGGEMSGEGLLVVTHAKGGSVVYQGRFEQGVIKEGSLTLRDGSRYEGEFSPEGEMHGRGRFESETDRNVYTGWFEHNVFREGQVLDQDGYPVELVLKSFRDLMN